MNEEQLKDHIMGIAQDIGDIQKQITELNRRLLILERAVAEDIERAKRNGYLNNILLEQGRK